MSAVSGTSPQFDPWTDGLAQHGDKARLGKLTPVEMIEDVVPLDRQFGIWPKRCVSEPAAMGTQSLGSLLVAVSGKVVEDHHGSRLDLRDQDLARTGCEGGTVHRPLMNQGAIRASGARPGIRVCVPQLPKGASMVRRVPRRARPRKRVRLVFAAVSSMKTTYSGRSAMAGKRCVNQSVRRYITPRNYPIRSFASSVSKASWNTWSCTSGISVTSSLGDATQSAVQTASVELSAVTGQSRAPA